jgi:hypothetical protein
MRQSDRKELASSDASGASLVMLFLQRNAVMIISGVVFSLKYFLIDAAILRYSVVCTRAKVEKYRV